MYTLKHINIAHSDERRDLSILFNGDFNAKQIKLIKVKKDSILGNHYHEYREMFYILKGQAKYFLEDIDLDHIATTSFYDREKELTLKQGDLLIIQPRIAHKAMFHKGTITIEATESEYISPEFNDKKYEVK